MSQLDIGVRKLNEGSDAWAIVPAQKFVANIYMILENNVEEEQGCELEFKPGDMVTVMEWADGEGRPFFRAMRLDGGLPL